MKMKGKTTIVMSLLVVMMTLIGCSEYDNGYTPKDIEFTRDFSREFGTFDYNQDWNLAERATVSVVTDVKKELKIYGERNGVCKQVGHFTEVEGLQKLAVDVEKGTQYIIVNDGEHALRTVKNGTVSFVDMVAYGGEAKATRIADKNRNQYQENYGDILPAKITAEEQAKVVAEFSKKREGVYNTKVIEWENIFIQQVYKGTARYRDGNGAEMLGSGQMNSMQMYTVGGPNQLNNNIGGTFDHVNDFNTGSSGVNFDDINGMTYLHDMNYRGVPTQTITTNGSQVQWVKQFAYHNSNDNNFHAEYIILEIDGAYYLGFDFYANGSNPNQQVQRDWVFNDWIVKLSKGKDTVVPVEELDDVPPIAWILAGEDLGGSFDVDYNDVVIKVEYLSGEDKAYITPMAAGGTLADYLFFDDVCIGEIHQLLGAEKAVSGTYIPMNVEGNAVVYTTERVEISVPTTWRLSLNESKDNNMGGFNIRALPLGTAAMDKVVSVGALESASATVVNAPTPGSAPYILCVPYTYSLLNTPEPGKKTIKVWEWPAELKRINSAYNKFAGWVENRNTNIDWYMYPQSNLVVKTTAFVVQDFGSQIQDMTAEENGEEPTNPQGGNGQYQSVPSNYIAEGARIPSSYFAGATTKVKIKITTKQYNDWGCQPSLYCDNPYVGLINYESMASSTTREWVFTDANLIANLKANGVLVRGNNLQYIESISIAVE